MTTPRPLDALSPRILCVDDEPHVLSALGRVLSERYHITTASSGEDGLRKLESEGPFDVAMSDMRMPGIDGAEFLSQVRLTEPDVMRLLLTGHADVESAIAAVNKGAIFRYLCKPCANDALFAAIEDSLAQQRLIRAERELLENTLSGAVQMLVQLLEQTAPAAFRRTAFIRHCVNHAIKRLGWPDAWIYDMAARLSQIGRVASSVTPREDDDDFDGGPLSDGNNPELAYELLRCIPRLEAVAGIVRYQGGDFPAKCDPVVRRGAQILEAAIALDHLVSLGASGELAGALLRTANPSMAEEVVAVFDDLRVTPGTTGRARLGELRVGDVIDGPVYAQGGLLLATRGQEVTEAVLTRLLRISRTVGLEEPIPIRIAG